MKKSIILIGAILLFGQSFAQSPDSMSFQAVLRDAENSLVTDQTVSMRISILQGAENGSPIYVETHTPTSNTNGMVSINIGSGTVIAGDFTAIDWANDTYFIKTETDLLGGTDYTISGTNQLMSVPYALHAKTAENITGQITELDPVFSAWDRTTGILISESQISDLNHTPQGIIPNNTPADGNLLTFDGTNWVAEDIVTSSTGSAGSTDNMMPYLTINYCIAVSGTFPSRSSANPLIGEIMMFAGDNCPSDWRLCNGQLLSIASYAALFSILGTTYGGDGTTTFGLPDLRGRAPIHVGQGDGLSDRSLGEIGGSESNALDISNLPSHSHSIIIQH